MPRGIKGSGKAGKPIMRDRTPADPKKFGVVQVGFNEPKTAGSGEGVIVNAPKGDAVAFSRPIQESSKPKLEPLGAGQAYFEAPDGTVLIGEDSREQIWYRAGNNGKGMWINKKR